MAIKLLQIIVIAAVIAVTLAELPVRIDEQHLRVPESQRSGNGWQDSVPGSPGKDYPNLTSIPKTSFTCAGKTPGGYYADVETRCQVFHVCNTEGTKSSFLCPSGSIFNQRHFVCDWWYDFECERAPDLYSLNDALDDHESTSDQSDDDRYTPNAPLPYNSISASNNDLSLASSGYPNNLRDEANLIYEDYASGKIPGTDGNSIPEKSAPDSTGNYVAGAVTSALSSTDNYSDARTRESTEQGRLNAREQHQSADYRRPSSDARSRNSYEHRDHRGRPNQLSDNVPRGFSNSHAEDHKRNDNGPGFFVNNGLFEERDKNQENTNALLRESNNLIDNQYNNNEFNKNQEKNSTSSNNKNNNNNSNIRYGIYYQNPEHYPLPQENNNYVINDNSRELKENSYYKNEKNSNNNYYINNEKNSNNNYYNNNEKKSNNNYYNNNEKNSNNNYYNNNEKNYNKNEINSNYQYNSNNETFSNYYKNSENVESHTQTSSTKYANYYEKSGTVESSSSSSVYDFTGEPYNRILEYAATTQRPISSAPSEDEVDREWQRVVDSTELKRNSAQRSSYDYESSASFLIREETGHPWREDLSTSSSNPPYPPEPEGGYSTLSRPEESTTPTVREQRAKFLGRRPTGGLLSGAGNGLPGAKKVLAGSVGITGKPGEDSASTVGPAWDSRDSYLPRNEENKGNEFTRDDGPYWKKQDKDYGTL